MKSYESQVEDAKRDYNLWANNQDIILRQIISEPETTYNLIKNLKDNQVNDAEIKMYLKQINHFLKKKVRKSNKKVNTLTRTTLYLLVYNLLGICVIFGYSAFNKKPPLDFLIPFICQQFLVYVIAKYKDHLVLIKKRLFKKVMRRFKK